MDLKVIQKGIETLEKEVTAQNTAKSLGTLVALQQQATTLQSQLNKAQGSTAKELLLERLKQIQQDLEVLLVKAEPVETLEITAHSAEHEGLLKDKVHAKQANRILDETLGIAEHTLAALNRQGDKLHELHNKLLGLTAKLMIGDQSLNHILRLENFGVFIGSIGAALIIIVWLFIKLVL